MIIYKNTFENIKSIGHDFPIEDQYYALDNEAIVADGITRDPIGESDLSLLSPEEFLKRYPRPSGAFLASKVIVEEFAKTTGTLKERLIKSNEKVKELNDKYVPNCDYLENDYYASVVSSAKIENNILYYAYICDCGVMVINDQADIVFQTEDDKLLYSDPFIDTMGIPWHLPEARRIVRSKYRNNLSNIVDGKCVSYGALTGEDSAINFIREGKLKLNKNDVAVVYSDGFTNLLKLKEIRELIVNFGKERFEEYIDKISKINYEQYGKEKTLIIMKGN